MAKQDDQIEAVAKLILWLAWYDVFLSEQIAALTRTRQEICKSLEKARDWQVRFN